ncbi:Tn3 family transposase, partial [Pseudomonas aeruginosa]|nr:Tn3 family transposase [Pseudomonas aeruginosa]
VLDSSISDDNVRSQLFNDLPRVRLEKALEEVTALIRPANDVFYLALEERYRSVRRFLPDLLKHIRFGFSPAGKGVAASLDWLQLNLPRRKPEDDAPQEIVAKA